MGKTYSTSQNIGCFRIWNVPQFTFQSELHNAINFKQAKIIAPKVRESKFIYITNFPHASRFRFTL